MPAIRVFTSDLGWQDVALVGPVGPQGPQGDIGPVGQDGIPQAFAGPYDNATTYPANTAVQYLGSSYICTQDTTGVAPGDAADVGIWLLMAQQASAGRTFTTTVGNGSATSFTITHNFNTRALGVAVYRNVAPFDEVEVDVERTDLNNVTIRTAPYVPAAAEFQVVVTSAGTITNPPALPPPVVTSLPASPIDGQECYYRIGASPAPKWHLRFSAAYAALDGYGWEFLGGSPISTVLLATTTALTTTVSAAMLATQLPLSGLYNIDFGGNLNVATAAQYALLGLYIGGAAVPNALAVGGAQGYVSAMNASMNIQYTVGNQLDVRGSTTSGTGNVGNRWLRATPVRVG